MARIGPSRTSQCSQGERKVWKSLSRVRLFATAWTVQSREFSRLEYWSGQPFPSSGDLPNSGIKPRYLALQEDSLPAQPQGKPRNTGVGSLSLLQWIFPTRESNQGLLHCRGILYQLSYQGSPRRREKSSKWTVFMESRKSSGEKPREWHVAHIWDTTLSAETELGLVRLGGDGRPVEGLVGKEMVRGELVSLQNHKRNIWGVVRCSWKQQLGNQVRKGSRATLKNAEFFPKSSGSFQRVISRNVVTVSF